MQPQSLYRVNGEIGIETYEGGEKGKEVGNWGQADLPERQPIAFQPRRPVSAKTVEKSREDKRG